LKPEFFLSDKLEVIEEKFSAEQTPKHLGDVFGSELSAGEKYDMVDLNNSCLDHRTQNLQMYNSVMEPTHSNFKVNNKTKVSVIIDWVSKELHYAKSKNKEVDYQLLERNKSIQQKLMFNFCSNA